MNRGHAFSVGVEEEFLLVHPTAAHLLPRGGAVVTAAKRLGVRLYEELTAAQIETNTPVCWTMPELRTALQGLRSVASTAARRAGARLLAAGAAVTDELPPTTDVPRYQRMAARFGQLVAEHGVCGCHVHIGLDDRETAIQVSNHLRPWLPTLLALTANSAVHGGRDTGHASWRSILWSRWPCAGPPPYFTSADHYETAVQRMIESGVALDPGMIYWDVRPSDHLPTIEIRVSDVPSTVDETELLATLVRGLVATAVRDLRAGDPAPRISAEVLRAAYWRGAHDGLRGFAIDPFTFRHTTPTQMLGALLGHIETELTELGDLQRARRLTARVLDEGNGAVRQRLALAHRGAVADVVDQATGTRGSSAESEHILRAGL